MKLNITTPVELAPPNSYFVEIKTYSGDGDSYSQFAMGPFNKGEDEAALHNLLDVLHRIETSFPNGRLGKPDYFYENTILGFAQWFGDSPSSTLEEMQEFYPKQLEEFGVEANEAVMNAVGERYSEDWPREEERFSGDGEIEETLDKYQVFYYGANSMKHNVEIDWKE